MNLKLNADRFTGKTYVSLYDKFRPEPPEALLLQTLSYLGKEQADLVVDLGCGTGISTRVWSDYGKKIMGIEPSEAMLSIAREKTKEQHISYERGFAHKLSIDSNSAEIVTCSQSFHWMEPQSTLKEIDRVLKDNGVLVIYDVIWPPSVNYVYERAYLDLFDTVNKITKGLGEDIAHRWDKTKHLKHVEQCQYFDYVKESYYHKSEKFNKEKFIGIALSQGGLEALLKRGFSEKETGITKFIQELESVNAAVDENLIYNYRVIFGVRKK